MSVTRLSIHFELNPPEFIASASGRHMFVTVRAGTFRAEGPGGSVATGVVVSGHDRAVIVGPADFTLDVYAVLRADDGTPVLVTMRGGAHRGDDTVVRASTAGRIETAPAGPLAWLNTTTVHADGESTPGAMDYLLTSMR